MSPCGFSVASPGFGSPGLGSPGFGCFSAFNFRSRSRSNSFFSTSSSVALSGRGCGFVDSGDVFCGWVLFGSPPWGGVPES